MIYDLNVTMACWLALLSRNVGPVTRELFIVARLILAIVPSLLVTD